jgi:hypothetical protein
MNVLPTRYAEERSARSATATIEVLREGLGMFTTTMVIPEPMIQVYVKQLSILYYVFEQAF